MFQLLDLFSGIGGFSLGLERSGGFRTVAFCEIEPFCRKVLSKHWPGVPIYEDVRTLTASQLRADGIVPDAICGGFPCQDISVAGKGAGIAGERSGLWSQYARIVGELRPRIVIVENVAALLGRGLSRVLADLAALGFDAEWHCIPASAVGAPHRRDRLWIVAHAVSRDLRDQPGRRHGAGRAGETEPRHDGAAGLVAHAHGGGRREQGHVGETQGCGPTTGHALRCGETVPDPENVGRTWGAPAAPGWPDSMECGAVAERSGGDDMGLTGIERSALGEGALREWAHAATTGTGWWATEPDVGRVVDGPAARVDRRRRLIALGNAVVPQIAEIIGRAILA